MFSNYQDNNRILNPGYALWGNPWGFKQITDTEQHMATRNKGKSGRGPHRDPRDFYLLFFTAIFTIFCCITGSFIGNSLGGGRGTVLGIIVGIIVGIFIGPRLVAYINKLRDKRWQRSETKQDKRKGNDQGPIIRQKDVEKGIK
jgi:uncharacterized protein YcfJ